jgi:hypothetical protein
LDGGAEGSRTPDLLIANETLYQLSYDPKPCVVRIIRLPENCKKCFGKCEQADRVGETRVLVAKEFAPGRNEKAGLSSGLYAHINKT